MADLLIGTGLVDRRRREDHRKFGYQDAVRLASLLPDAIGSEFRSEYVHSLLDEYEAKATHLLDWSGCSIGP